MSTSNFPPRPPATGHHVSDNEDFIDLSNFSSFINDDDSDDDNAVVIRDTDYSPVPVTDNEGSYV